uniref:Uncharacterized protein n=1 Tax=Spumella elongata TaxID=89044 RepID=A0A7S3M4T0_9STRA|mmetsp:Transcript_31922/g.54562  ORF Transcript_31922/g.54562 Transcript_31922/m.54562 type:complete len:106 (+) Transcript_31922:74-391(+)|eukprot:CAMPEP_0184990010 /NCGR_PEP_ID=MMETSP1098-20130426/30617_1 /TAXON_ID=89044 /ORGANISM="Spumella elongata, Strain CCAP 955/1" /LENGTH=105 /DNA_ID=CAMNT_0027515129 /DNA_START=74 /DNA_END=391 /DNA_ORIENTATION=-
MDGRSQVGVIASEYNLRDDTEHISFVQRMINEASDAERVNYVSYLKALREGLLENHKGRYIYISKGKMLNKSFKRPHDVLDHFPQNNEVFPYTSSNVIYVPCLHK